MQVYTETLPERKASKRTAITWTRTETDDSPAAGVLTIHTDRATCVYRVDEFPAEWAGRAFMLFKGDAGTDATAERYAVFCGRHGHQMCECKGFERFGHCKHCDACEALIANGWV